MRTTLELGAQLDTLTRGELRDELTIAAQTHFQQYARGVKYLRMPITSAAVASSTFTIAGSTTGLGPREGYIWTIRRILVQGLTSGATPDVANLYRNNTSGIPVWQFTGNAFQQTFGKTELLLLPGEHLSLAGVGTIAATGTIFLTGDLIEVSAEQFFKLL